MFPKHGFACLFLLSVLCYGAPALSLAASADPSADTKLSALEVKLFAHAYAKDCQLDRVARIERFVFGASKADGSINERIATLAGTVNIKNVGDPPYLPKKQPFSDWTPATSQQFRPAVNQTTSGYPRVMDLEQRLFGENYALQPIVTRLDRLELKVFGRVSRSSDLAVRVDALVSYVVPEPQVPVSQIRMASYGPILPGLLAVTATTMRTFLPSIARRNQPPASSRIRRQSHKQRRHRNRCRKAQWLTKLNIWKMLLSGGSAQTRRCKSESMRWKKNTMGHPGLTATETCPLVFMSCFLWSMAKPHKCQSNRRLNIFAVCPCGSQMLLQECCNRYHTGSLPGNALELMRSRYSAYALGNVDYIIETTYRVSPVRSSNLTKWKAELLEFCQNTNFEKLEILAFIDGVQIATVTFKANLTQSGRDATFTEKSTFVKENGRWFYKDGKFLQDS